MTHVPKPLVIVESPAKARTIAPHAAGGWRVQWQDLASGTPRETRARYPDTSQLCAARMAGGVDKGAER